MDVSCVGGCCGVDVNMGGSGWTSTCVGGWCEVAINMGGWDRNGKLMVHGVKR